MSSNTPKFLENSLYRRQNEHDSCGVGLVAKIDGTPSHNILRMGIVSVCNVVHRGAISADLKTGDGAGVLTQIPKKIFVPEAERLCGKKITNSDELGVAMCFLPEGKSQDFTAARALIENVCQKRGLIFYGWRHVPVKRQELGVTAKESLPTIQQAIVGKAKDFDNKDENAFERLLYITRKEIEFTAKQRGIRDLYICSFSSRLITYKAMLIATALKKFYTDLANPAYETAICLYHQRFSTNTFPSWPLAQPLRLLAHNGEINTLRGNRNWFASRESDFPKSFWGEDAQYLRDTIDPECSDSVALDNVFELIIQSGRDIEHAMRMLVPAAWKIDPKTSKEEKAFYQYHECFCEPWDGPAALVYTDGIRVAASLDRNGLRPSRYKIDKDGIFTLGSEVGVVEIAEDKIISKGRLSPGQMISLDTKLGKIHFNEEIKQRLAKKQNYQNILDKNQRSLKKSSKNALPKSKITDAKLLSLQNTFDLNKEELDMVIKPMAQSGIETVYSMGDDASIAVLSKKPRLLSSYFRQLFAQVTNPPIDPIREMLVMSLEVCLGRKQSILAESPEHARVIRLKNPIISGAELAELQSDASPLKSETFNITWEVKLGAEAMLQKVDRLCRDIENAVDDACEIIILSDRNTDKNNVPISSLLACGAVHHHLIKVNKRLQASIVIDTGEARDVHQIACLFGFGAQAICPYLAFWTIAKNYEKNPEDEPNLQKSLENYKYALDKGIMKIMSKMGVATLASYQGAQIFEALGLSKEVIRKCFNGAPSPIGGVEFLSIAKDSLRRHEFGFGAEKSTKLPDPGYNRLIKNGETHAITRNAVKHTQQLVRRKKEESYEAYKEGLRQTPVSSLQDLLDFATDDFEPIEIDEVEPIEEIMPRFTTAAMSLGALSPETHEAIAIAMNRIGGKSNSGEGGEDTKRFLRLPNGDWANSAIKQIASGRFGVSAEYLINAQELEIKMAQGAKPGEGGQLPAHKVTGLIARLRHTQPGVQLISPPPHHDIYSIEDLAQLIHDLKEINPRARVCVKLVSVNGVGTIAAGVAKAKADIILISGHDGGTGASPLSSIKNAGSPWVLGLAETQQVLMANALRDRVTLRTDGGFRSGLDIVKAACLGAEEYNFGTMALIALGCVYVRQCHLNNCPTGIATTDPKWRKKFRGKPEHLVTFLQAVAGETRQIMARLGVRELNELIGQPKYLRQKRIEENPKANALDLSVVLRDVGAEMGEGMERYCINDRNDGAALSHPLDDKILLQAREAIRLAKPIELSYKINNRHRDLGVKLSGEVAYEHGNYGLREDTIKLNFSGSAGQSFGAFLCGGIRMELIGEANDYVGKGMSSGSIIIKLHPDAVYAAEENVIIGNTCLYGATGGKLYADGVAGERFAVRNSGATAVVAGVGDHACEYMTGGKVVVLGTFGKNFGAGMSGGKAYVYDREGVFGDYYNPEMVKFGLLGEAERGELHALVMDFAELADSKLAWGFLNKWVQRIGKFIKVEPKSA